MNTHLGLVYERLDALLDARDGDDLQEVLLHLPELVHLSRVGQQLILLLRRGDGVLQSQQLLHVQHLLVQLKEGVLDGGEVEAEARQLDGDDVRALGVHNVHPCALLCL
jgi:hypothetical protein